jgi:hypothetical protein
MDVFNGSKQIYIDNYALAILLSINISAYKGNITSWSVSQCNHHLGG